MKFKEKMKLVEYKTSKLADTDLISRIDKYWVRYCQAIKEAWSEDYINGGHDNYSEYSCRSDLMAWEILERNGLGNYDERDGKFYWDWELKDLDKQLRMFLKV